MGVAVRPGWLAVGTRTQVWFLRNDPSIAAKLEPRGRYDACFLARFSHFTGNLQCHELAWVPSPLDTGLWIVNTAFSCLCTLHASYSFAPSGARPLCPPWYRRTAVI